MSYQPKLYQPGEAPTRRMGGVIIAYGFEGVGKTTFAINSWEVAEPMFFCNFDRSASHLLTDYKGEAGFYYEEFLKADTKAEAKTHIDKLEGMVNAACNVGSGVFVIDNGANAWGLVKRAFLPESGSREPYPKEYEDANFFFKNMILSLEQAGLWVIVTAPARQLWFGAKTDSVDGEKYYEAEGFRSLKYMSIITVWLHLSLQSPGAVARPSGNPFSHTYHAEYRSVKYRPEIEGVVLDDPTLKTVLKGAKAI